MGGTCTKADARATAAVAPLPMECADTAARPPPPPLVLSPLPLNQSAAAAEVLHPLTGRVPPNGAAIARSASIGASLDSFAFPGPITESRSSTIGTSTPSTPPAEAAAAAGAVKHGCLRRGADGVERLLVYATDDDEEDYEQLDLVDWVRLAAEYRPGAAVPLRRVDAGRWAGRGRGRVRVVPAEVLVQRRTSDGVREAVVQRAGSMPVLAGAGGGTPTALLRRSSGALGQERYTVAFPQAEYAARDVPPRLAYVVCGACFAGRAPHRFPVGAVHADATAAHAEQCGRAHDDTAFAVYPLPAQWSDV
jgi:hypothetical protein